jgi:hypothetical protein
MSTGATPLYITAFFATGVFSQPAPAPPSPASIPGEPLSSTLPIRSCLVSTHLPKLSSLESLSPSGTDQRVMSKEKKVCQVKEQIIEGHPRMKRHNAYKNTRLYCYPHWPCIDHQLIQCFHSWQANPGRSYQHHPHRTCLP